MIQVAAPPLWESLEVTLGSSSVWGGERGSCREKGLIKTSLGGTSEQLPHPPAECHLRTSGHTLHPRAGWHWHSRLPPVTAPGIPRALPAPQPACATCPAHIPTLCCLRTAWERDLSMAVWGLGPGCQCFIAVLWFWSVDGAPVRL